MRIFGIGKQANRDQKFLLKAINKTPNEPKLHVELGWLYAESRQYCDAQQSFSRAVELGADPQTAADATYGLALIHIEQNAFEQARERLRIVLRDCPTFSKRPEVHFALAQVNEHLWRQASWKNERERLDAEYLQRALDHYQQAIERGSEQHATAEFLLGNLLCEISRQDEALPHLKIASQHITLDQKETFELHVLLGTLYQQQQDFANAKAAFETALKKGGKPAFVADVQYRLGQIAQAQNDDDQAVMRYEKALTAHGETQSDAVLDMLVNLSEIRFRHHWQQDAVGYAERALQFPQLTEAARQRVLKVLAQGYAALKAYDKAIPYEDQYFDTVHDHDAKAESLLRLGNLHEEQQQDKEAVDAYRKGLKFSKRNLLASKLNAAIGRIYLREDRLNQAINNIKDALEHAAEEPTHAASVYRLLGECHAKRKEMERAIEAYGTILAKYKESQEEQFARQELKTLRKDFKKEIQELERQQAAQQQAAQDEKRPPKPISTEEQERLVELIDQILDEKGFFERLKEGLLKTHLGLVSKIEQLLASRANVDEELIENLEEILILSDMGVKTTQRIIDSLRERVSKKELKDTNQVKFYLKREVQAILEGHERPIDVSRATPFVILVIGVNGTGKTTTIGKLASKFKGQGKNVLIAAGDTFRAAAIEQLEIWGERAGCEVIKHASGADPSAVLFDAVKAAKSRNVDVLIADTAGRLHTKHNLMEELRKMTRVISREMPGAPHEVLMVIDATTGQNAIQQAQIFNEGIGITSFALTKLDGTAKGGIIVGISNEMNIPISYIGIGEKVEDLREFNAKDFVEALFEE